MTAQTDVNDGRVVGEHGENGFGATHRGLGRLGLDGSILNKFGRPIRERFHTVTW